MFSAYPQRSLLLAPILLREKDPKIGPRLRQLSEAPDAGEDVRSPVVTQSAGSGVDPAGSGASRPVLVVDDDPGVRGMLRELLESLGLAVATVGDGYAAVEVAAHTPVSLILLDLNLPDYPGELVADVLRRTLGAQVPLILISGDPRAEARAREVAATALLRKPLDLDDISAIVTTLAPSAARESGIEE